MYQHLFDTQPPPDIQDEGQIRMRALVLFSGQNGIGRRVVDSDCTELDWTTDRTGGPGRESCTASETAVSETEELSGKWQHRLLPAGPWFSSSPRLQRKGTRAPGRSLRVEVRGHCGTSFLKETRTTRRRHDSGVKFRPPGPDSRSSPCSGLCCLISSYADIRGAGRAADAVEVGSRPWFRFCPASPARARCRDLGRQHGCRHIRHTESSGRRHRHTGSTTSFSASRLGLLPL
jgi:hypothetical protein